MPDLHQNANAELLSLFFFLFELIHFNPVFHFYTIWECQKIFGFLIFSGGIEMEH